MSVKFHALLDRAGSLYSIYDEIKHISYEEINFLITDNDRLVSLK